MTIQNSIPISIGINTQNFKFRKLTIWSRYLPITGTGLELPASRIQNPISTILTVITFLISLNLSAQITQPAQYERPHKGSDHECNYCQDGGYSKGYGEI